MKLCFLSAEEKIIKDNPAHTLEPSYNTHRKDKEFGHKVLVHGAGIGKRLEQGHAIIGHKETTIRKAWKSDK